MVLLKIIVFFIAICIVRRDAHSHNNENMELANFSPTQAEWLFFDHCLAKKRNLLSEKQNAKCDNVLEIVQRMHEIKSPIRHKRFCTETPGNSRILPDEMYNLELAKMRNHVHDPEQMLSLIAPCSKFSNSVKNRWRAFFRPRTGRIKTELNTVFPSRQNLLNGEIEAVFNLPASFNASAFAQHEIVAVDLSILRVPPCKIDEILGIYTLNVDQILGNRTRNIHRSKQATCPTLGGHMMVAELRLNPIKNWFYQSDIPLMLRVQLHTERLVVGSQSEALQDTSNLRKVLSLTIHHKLGNAQQQVQPTSIKRHSRYLGRSKRSLSNIRSKLTTSDCRIVNYPYKLQTYGEEFEILYPKVWNIKECVGRCSYPLFNMNSTNHGIAMSEQLAFHPNPPFQPTVDCVPIAFGDIYHVTYGPDRILQSGFISKLEANYCGCA